MPPKKEGARRPLSPEAFQERAAVSRETLDRFHLYAALLTKWNRAINLVSAASMADLWRRHFLDSAQLRCFLPAAQAGDGLIILDVGTGAGFPGLVLALLGCGEVHLVEADRRKAEFLREAVRVTGANAQVHAARIEALTAFPVDVVTCRAFAPLPQILDLTERFLLASNRGIQPVGLFLKGRRADEELTAAAKKWRLRLERFASETDPEASILRLRLQSLGDEAT
ncbi:MAG TPA: 16S rRNA (guanine(527)-N(7))-methyltransferase RsmG [Kiloniellaceae bacterium]